MRDRAVASFNMLKRLLPLPTLVVFAAACQDLGRITEPDGEPLSELPGPNFSMGFATLIDFNSEPVSTSPLPVLAGGVSVSFSNLAIIEIGAPLASFGGFGGAAGANNVFGGEGTNFNGRFLTGLGPGGTLRTDGFVRTIEFDMAVTHLSMYVADLDSDEGITANAFDEFDMLLSTLVFPSTLGLDGKVLLVDFGTVSGIRKITLVGNDPVGIDNLSFSPVTSDEDGDSVLDDVDFCPGTVIPEGVPTVRLGTNRWALIDGDFDFDTTAPKGKGPQRSYNTTETGGCSCEQIIAAQGLGQGHTKFGCSISAMDDWVAIVAEPTNGF